MKSIASELLGPHQRDLQNNFNKDGDKKLKGWRLTPNVSELRIETQDGDPAFVAEGIFKNYPTVVKFKPYLNGRMRKYMNYQVLRLHKLKKTREFFDVVKFLNVKSSTFRIAAITHVFPNGYKQFPLKGVERWNEEVTDIFKKGKDDLIYERRYIEKGDTFRPLGIPTPPGRIALHMGANGLQLYLEDYYLPSQHGFLGTKGCKTAGTEVLTKVVNYDFIGETDLKQFFPSVHVNEISNILEKCNVPKGVVYYLENLNLNQPVKESLKEGKLDEGKYLRTIQDYEDIKNGYFRGESPMYDPVRDFIRHNGVDILYEITGSTNIFEIVQEQGALFGEYGNSKVEGMYEGLPQGSPISPILSILVLKDFLQQELSVSYADDPIFYSNKDMKIRDDPNLGVKINLEKSSGVRREGKGLKPLTYLGLIGTPEELKSKKYGLSLTGDKAKSLYWSIEKKELKNGGELSKGKYFGFLLSRLYAGSWNLKDYEQNFELYIRNNGSLLMFYMCRFKDLGSKKRSLLTTFTASSYCFRFYLRSLRIRLLAQRRVNLPHTLIRKIKCGRR